MVHRTIGVKMLLPTMLLAAVFVALSTLSTEAASAVKSSPFSKQKRKLRKHHEVFQLPKSKGSRRKGSHKNSYEKPEESPPYLDQYYQYDEETVYPNPVDNIDVAYGDDDLSDFPVLTDEEHAMQYYGVGPTEEPTDEVSEELTLPPINMVPEIGYSKSFKGHSKKSSKSYYYYKGSSSKLSQRSKGVFAKQKSGVTHKVKGQHGDYPRSPKTHDVTTVKKGSVTKSSREKHFANYNSATKAGEIGKSKGTSNKRSRKSDDDCVKRDGVDHLRMGKKKTSNHGYYEYHDGNECKSSNSKGRGRSSSKGGGTSKGKGKGSKPRSKC